MAFNGSPNDDVYQYGYGNSQNMFGHPYITETSSICHSEESNFWSSPRSNSPSSSGIKSTNSVGSPYQMYATLSFSPDENKSHYKTGYGLGLIHSEADSGVHLAPPFMRVVKRRTTANKKERRRTLSINNAYSDLRDCIPNIPHDSKLSKIKTLRLATSYISYLTGVLENDDPAGGFKVELGNSGRRSNNTSMKECSNNQGTQKISDLENCSTRRAKGRTGWPQHVWALELKQEQTL